MFQYMYITKKTYLYHNFLRLIDNFDKTKSIDFTLRTSKHFGDLPVHLIRFNVINI